MPAHPQSSHRGVFAKQAIYAGAQALTQNSTGVTFSGAVTISGQATVGKLSANSTAILIPTSGFQFGALTTRRITSNSTGVRIGALYISANSTGNTTT